MKYGISRDARPQATVLLTAAVISIVLWFIPYAEILTYPFRIFVTFVHEGGHALAALLTGNSVASLSIATNASGETYTSQGGALSQMFVASAGYLGSMAFGALLLVLIRKAVAARIVLIGSATLVFALTAIYGLIKPAMTGVVSSALPFTILAGTLLSVGRSRSEIRNSASSFILRQPAGRSVHTQCAARSENRIFPVFALCALGTHGCGKHGKRPLAFPLWFGPDSGLG